MATPLFWEPLRISSFVFNKLLRYEAPLQYDPDNKCFKTKTENNKMFYSSICALFTFALALVYVVVDFCLVGSIEKPPYVIILNFTALISGVCILASILPALENSEVWWNQYCNNTIALEGKVVKHWDNKESKECLQIRYYKLWIRGI